MRLKAGSKLTIAIDGPAGAGKTTIARQVAAEFGLGYVDTGAMYRALALKALNRAIDPSDERALSELLPGTKIELQGDLVILDGADVTAGVRSETVTATASRVAIHPSVRKWMVTRQRQIVEQALDGVVVEGRDIGTVVLPGATVKIFLTAAPEERAERRAKQDGRTGAALDPSMRERDKRDQSRSESPLRRAEDAVVIDSSGQPLRETVAAVVELVKERIF